MSEDGLESKEEGSLAEGSVRAANEPATENVLKFETQLYKVRDEEYIIDVQVILNAKCAYSIVQKPSMQNFSVKSDMVVRIPNDC